MQDYLEIMGIQRWARRATQSGCSSVDQWQVLQQQVSKCNRCNLCENRTQTVFGVGDKQADLLIVGEAPGYNEDKQGEPFVGRAGQLLNKMLAVIGLTREQVYIANVLKCRPPNNRDPKAEEIAQCTQYLEQQVALLQPKLILAVGRYAAHYLLDTKLSLTKLRNQTHQFRATEIPLIVSYHPAYLLRNPADKGKAFMDLLHVQQFINTKRNA